MRARARALAVQLRPKLPRARRGKTFFFLSSANARNLEPGFFLPGTRQCAGALTPRLRQSAWRGVRRLTALLAKWPPASRRSLLRRPF